MEANLALLKSTACFEDVEGRVRVRCWYWCWLRRDGVIA